MGLVLFSTYVFIQSSLFTVKKKIYFRISLASCGRGDGTVESWNPGAVGGPDRLMSTRVTFLWPHYPSFTHDKKIKRLFYSLAARQIITRVRSWCCFCLLCIIISQSQLWPIAWIAGYSPAVRGTHSFLLLQEIKKFLHTKYDATRD